MRLPPHVPSQVPLRPVRSALSLLAAGRSEAAALPFRRKGPTGLTARLDVRVAPGEKEQLAAIARDAGLAVAELVRLRALGRPVVSRTDATTVRELRRLGGLLKMIHVESGGAYRQQTAELLTTLRAAVGKLAGGQ
jgi:hypothetical protein